MPRKVGSEDGTKAKQRSKKDAAKRNFELNGTYSAKHLRAREVMAAERAQRPKGKQ